MLKPDYNKKDRNKGKSRGRKPRIKASVPRKASQDKFEDKGHTYDVDSKAENANDIVWWNHNPELTKAAGKLSFNNPLGVPVYWDNSVLNFPGVAKIQFAPTIGRAQEIDDPVNVAATNIYSFVRSKNSGAVNYEAPDYMMYNLTVDSFYLFHAWMVRVYGLVNSYTILNRYVPRVILEAMNVDFASLSGRLADFNYFINQFAVRIGSLAVTDGFDYYQRHRWLVSHIWADAGNDKAQFYFYDPQFLYTFQAKTSEHGSQLLPLQFKPLTGEKWTLDELIAYAEELLGDVLLDTDIGTFSGDTLKAFGPENLIQIPMIDETYSLKPEYNVEVLGQIHNTVLLGALDITKTNISQSDSVINANYVLGNPGTDAWQVQYTQLLLNSYDDDPSEEQVMEFTRNMSLANIPGTEAPQEVLLCGTEIMTNCTIYLISGNALNTVIIPTSVLNSSGTNFANLLTRTLAFDWFPILYRAGGLRGFRSPMADIRNFTTIDVNKLRILHETALLSAFNVEQIGRSAFTLNR
nr:capsid protein [Rat picobirnavirus]